MKLLWLKCNAVAYYNGATWGSDVPNHRQLHSVYDNSFKLTTKKHQSSALLSSLRGIDGLSLDYTCRGKVIPKALQCHVAMKFISFNIFFNFFLPGAMYNFTVLGFIFYEVSYSWCNMDENRINKGFSMQIQDRDTRSFGSIAKFLFFRWCYFRRKSSMLLCSITWLTKPTKTFQIYCFDSFFYFQCWWLSAGQWELHCIIVTVLCLANAINRLVANI